MIGVTVTNRKMEEVSRESVRRFMKHTRLPATVMHVHDNIQAFRLKMQLWRMFPTETVVFFDSDLWFQKDIDLSGFDGVKFAAVRDPFASAGHLKYDEERYGIEIDNSYVNTGFMIWTVAPFAPNPFEYALRIYDRHKADPGPLYDQTPVNVALQELKTPITYLPPDLNFLPLAIKHGIASEPDCVPTTVHAAGWSDKMETLQFYSTKYTRTNGGHLSWNNEEIRT